MNPSSKLVASSFLSIIFFSEIVNAHGTMTDPISRVYQCRQEGPESPDSDACKAAVQEGDGPQQFYNWSAVAQGGANGDHKAFVPDGMLCSGGNTGYAGLDLARSDWPATSVKANENYTFKFFESAPHQTSYFKYYITKDSYDLTQALTWNDLELFCEEGAQDAEAKHEKTCTLPNKVGKHILYTVWQRSDSWEAFYACSDIDFSSSTTAIKPINPVTPTEPIDTITPVEPVSPTMPTESGSWDSTQIYTDGDEVTYNGVKYKAAWWTRGDIPGSAQWGPWKESAKAEVIIPPKEETTPVKPIKPTVSGSWNADKVYTSGDEITYNGMKYKAAWWTRGDIPGSAQWGVWKETGKVSETVDPVEPTMPVQNINPSLKVLSPSNNAVFTLEKLSEILVQFDASDSDGTVDFTMAMINGKHYDMTRSANRYSLKWVPEAFGEYKIMLHATDNDLATTKKMIMVNLVQKEVGESNSGVSEQKVQSRLSALGLSQNVFEKMFPHRNNNAGISDETFSYDNFVKAVAFYPEFANINASPNVSDLDSKRELAAFLANTAQETTGGWGAYEPINSANDYPTRYTYGIYFLEEVGCESGNCTQYCDSSSWQSPEVVEACSSGKTFHGRGPIQLSWNYNYALMGESLGLKDETGKNLLLQSPEMIKEDGVLGFRAALWFWMTAQSPKPSAHLVMTNEWIPSDSDFSQGRSRGFGMTLNIINGGIECGKSADTAKQEGRMGHYRVFSLILGLDDPKTQSTDVTYGTSSHLDKLSARKLGCNGLDKMNSY